MPNESLDPIYLKLDYKKELYTYTIDWNFDVDHQGRNVLFDYSKFSKQSQYNSNNISCKNGFFHGPEKYFEFSLQLVGREELTVFVKMSYLNTDNGDFFEIYRMSTVTVIALPSRLHKEKKLTSNSNPNSSDKARPNENSTVQWMATYYNQSCVYITGLKFQIDMTWETGRKNPLHSNSGTTYSTALRNPTDFSSYLYSANCSDVTLYCENKEYLAHKLLLSSKSSVFRTMFSIPMMENKTGKVNIEDTEPEILEEFLRYIYTGSVKDMDKYALGIILIADKYDVQDLKLLSETPILTTTSNENVLECFRIGKLVDSEAIVKKCVQKIKADKRIIWKTKDEFLEAHRKFPELMFEAFM